MHRILPRPKKKHFKTLNLNLTLNFHFHFNKTHSFSTISIPCRSEQLKTLQTNKQIYDVLVVGGGATGCGIAMDAASRGLSVACVERGDFASETSSRSTKLIWAGIRYLATSAAGLLRAENISRPIDALKDFYSEFHMVVNCHAERRYMLEKNSYLCNWVPIAIPFTRFIVTPAPFGHPLFSLFPILCPLVLKFYDSLSSFTCPPSYVMTSNQRAREKFPQLSETEIKFVAVFFEAQHNDSRTNVAIAMTAAEKGAHIANYCEVNKILVDETTGVAQGVRVVDKIGDKSFEVKAAKIIFAGGPFTDLMRELENDENPDSGNFKPAVQGASGTHIVLPGYYCPRDVGLLDYNTSDGRFLFFLPWQGHTLVGTTDKQCGPETLPTPPEDEVQWLLNETAKYLNKDLRVRRSDVLSAWRGWRPLAADPHADADAPVSRDHVISENPRTKIMFVAGGKWTTWREMAQDAVDKITTKVCTTKTFGLIGAAGFSKNLPIKLVQKYGIDIDVADHLVKAYGGQAWEVANLNEFDLIHPKFPYINAEVVYACRNEYAQTVEDVITRRTRLAFLNKKAALQSINKVADVMAKELKWSEEETSRQIDFCNEYVQNGFGGSEVVKSGAKLRAATFRDVIEIFNAIDVDKSGSVTKEEVGTASALLGFSLTSDELDDAFQHMDSDGNGRVDLQEFEEWWNSKDEAGDNDFHRQFHEGLTIGSDINKIHRMGSGTMLG